MIEPADLPSAAVLPVPTAQLRHELPDGAPHVDWLIAQDRQGQRPLITFRLPARLDSLDAGAAMPAERIGDHRPIYLEYQGPVEGGRGCVVRVARGEILALSSCDSATASDWELQIAWKNPDDDASAGGRIQDLRLTRLDSANWRVVCGRIRPVDR